MEGSSDELKSRVGGERLEVTLEDQAQADTAIAALAPIAGEERPSCTADLLSLPMRRDRGGIAEAVRRLDGAGVGIDDIAVRRPTLDDVFIALTGHAAEHEGEEADEPGEPARAEERAA